MSIAARRFLLLLLAIAGPLVSAPGAADAVDFVSAARSLASAESGVPADQLELASRHTSAHTGVVHLAFRQRVAGLLVWQGDLLANFLPDGRLLNLHPRLHPAPSSGTVNALSPSDQAALLGPAQIARTLSAGGPVSITEPETGANRACVIEAPVLSLDPVPAEQVWWPAESGWRVAWKLRVRSPDHTSFGEVLIDAATAEELDRSEWSARDQYRAFPPNLRHPDDGARTLWVDPADPVASPFGWHDLDGLSGGDTTDTSGNNVFAQEDTAGDNTGGRRADGGVTLNFDFPLDLASAPESNEAAALAQVFAVTNWIHDVLYAYGFVESAGNFQENNYGEGGLAGDAVRVDILDPGLLNNASFDTPTDGSPGRMQLHLFAGARALVEVLTPESIAGPLLAGRATFGPQLDETGVTGTLVLAQDLVEAGGTATDACSTITNAAALAGNIAVVDRGLCRFDEKIPALQAVGASAVIVVNNDGDEAIDMGGNATGLTISSVLIGQSAGDLIKAELPSGVTATLSLPAALRRDSAFSNDLVMHEYGHGLSTRLTGGPTNSGCLGVGQAGAMGEGWSDYLALALTSEVGDQPDPPRPFATWANFEAITGTGIRNLPYSRNLATNNRQYGQLAGLVQPHGRGEIWASALYDLHWALIFEHGFDPDWIGGAGGNTLALQLVIDGMMLQPCTPTYLEARDAILLADQVLTGGANECSIWDAFSRRGMGQSADDGGNVLSTGVTAAFDLPIACPEPGAGLSAIAALATLAVWRRTRQPRHPGSDRPRRR